GYATGVFSSRKLERGTYDCVAMRFISADTHPDHDTIANFRMNWPGENNGWRVKRQILQALPIIHLEGKRFAFLHRRYKLEFIS
ncbi:MAG: hypothetical protein LBJ14_08935, partial [Desulfarculales bacterium]|nr:hypothetical protein [Desulfarculales bacterium]